VQSETPETSDIDEEIDYLPLSKNSNPKYGKKRARESDSESEVGGKRSGRGKRRVASSVYVEIDTVRALKVGIFLYGELSSLMDTL
jgi:hypothetical protein